MISKLIVINGKLYNNVDEMPEDVRKQFGQAIGMLKDENQNHIPDVLENMSFLADKDRDGVPDVFENTSSNVIISGEMQFIVDGISALIISV